MRSSPPPCLVHDNPSLTPDLLAVPSTIVTKKRRFSFTDNLSSDPLFSDDVSEAEMLGDGHRRKRTVKCPWWELRARKMTMTMTVAQRPARATTTSKIKAVDSGVWMGSDETTSEDAFHETPAESITSAVHPSLLAAKLIQSCLEDGNQVVDLSNLWLDELSDDALRPLHHLVPRSSSTDNRAAPSEADYRPLLPSIQLYLSSNRLLTLPREVLSLPIRVLSLRNNWLTQLPYNIERLQGLQELNIAGNQLQHLPWGLFAVIRLASPALITLRPNPFLSLSVLPADGYAALQEQFQQRLRKIRQAHPFTRFADARLKLSVYLASSAIRRLGVDGALCVRIGTSIEPSWAPVMQENPVTNPDDSKVPSLFELALRKAQQSQLPNDISQLLPPGSPANVVSALTAAAENQYHGNDFCSTCCQEMLISRAEWVEYWLHDGVETDLSEDSVIPFLRKACSARCSKPTAPGTFWFNQRCHTI